MPAVIVMRHCPAHIHSYENALQIYESITPVRGRAGDIRPLGKRRDQHLRIAKCSDRQGNPVIELVLYDTAVLTYYQSGEIKIYVDQFPTISTANFINHFAPYGVGAIKSGNTMIIHCRAKDGSWRQYRVSADTNEMLLKPTQDERGAVYWSPDYAPTMRIHSMDRKVMSTLRKLYAPLRESLMGTCRLMNYTYSRDLLDYMDNVLNNCIDTLDEYDIRELEIAHVTNKKSVSTHRVMYRNVSRLISFNNPTWAKFVFGLLGHADPEIRAAGALYVMHAVTTYDATRDKAEKEVSTSFDRFIIALHRDEVLRERVLEQGEVKDNPYAWAFTYEELKILEQGESIT